MGAQLFSRRFDLADLPCRVRELVLAHRLSEAHRHISIRPARAGARIFVAALASEPFSDL